MVSGKVPDTRRFKFLYWSQKLNLKNVRLQISVLRYTMQFIGYDSIKTH